MNRYPRLKRHLHLLIILMGLAFASCKVEKITTANEGTKDLTGTWKVVQATRNGTNLIPLYDFTQFILKFDAKSQSYTLTNPLPFIVGTNGKYALDDPQYPFKLTFTASGGTPVTTSFNYPIVAGSRAIILSFSPGCTLNTYVYTFTKGN
jgi:hypothetical protein